MKPRAMRQQFSGRTGLLPEIPEIGWDRFARATRTLDAHTHRRSWEFCYIEDGSVDWWAGDRVFEVRRGDVYITRPSERHGGVDAMMQPCALFWIMVEIPPRGNALPGLNATDTHRLRNDLARLKQRAFPSSPALAELFRQIHGAHLPPRSPHAAVRARAALHLLLIQLLTDHDAFMQRRGDAAASESLLAALMWMEANLAENYTVADVARVAGLRVSRFHEMFVSQTGYTPNDYRTRQRIRRAKQLLRSGGRSVTHIAMDLGFSTSQYFATVFKSLTGLTPVDYRKQASLPAHLSKL